MSNPEKTSRKKLEALAKVFGCLSTEEEWIDFCNEFFSPQEQADFIKRWNVFTGLLRGKTQREVKKEAEISISKVSRCAKAIKEGTGISSKVFQRLEEK